MMTSGGSGGSGGATMSTGGSGGVGGATMTSGGTGGTGGGPECVTDMDCGKNRQCTANGTCICADTAIDCMGTCVDPMTDKDHCGMCDVACGNKCVSGVCDDPVSLAAGGNNTCAAMARGEVYCWGRTDAGQLGMMVADPTGVPVKVAGLQGVKITRVFVGKNVDATHICGVSDVGDLYCWGSNQAGKLGINIAGDPTPKPPTKVPGIVTIQSVGLGQGHSLASNGQKILAWGANDAQVLGYIGAGTPQPNNTSQETGSAVAAGGLHSCALSDFDLRCWGRNIEGQVGAGNNTNPLLPVTVDFGGEQVAEVAAGDAFTCARLGATGLVYCWGMNDKGQLGLGDMMGQNKPTEDVNLGGVYATAIAAGSKHAGAIVAGHVYLWGLNDNGQVDSSMQAVQTIPSPFQVVAFDFSMATELALGAQHSCALDKVGTATRVVCWGGNSHGQVGDGTLTGNHKPPMVVQFP